MPLVRGPVSCELWYHLAVQGGLAPLLCSLDGTLFRVAYPPLVSIFQPTLTVAPRSFRCTVLTPQYNYLSQQAKPGWGLKPVGDLGRCLPKKMKTSLVEWVN